MATVNIYQDWEQFLAKEKITVIFPNASELNLIASDLGEDGVSGEPEGPSVTRLPVMFGNVGVAEIARGFKLTIQINKTLPIAQTWITRSLENSIVTGGVIFTDDVGSEFSFTQVSISHSGITGNGKQATYDFEVECIQPVNTSLVV